MKILNVNMSIDPVTGGGTAERTFQISRFLVAAGAECTILTTDFGLKQSRIEQVRSAGIKLITLPSILPRFYLPKFSLRFLKDLIAGFDIVHLMNHWTALNVLVSGICMRIGQPYVVCPGGTLEVFGRSVLAKKLFNLLVGRRMIGSAAAHIAIPTAEVSAFRPYGIPSSRVTVIPNGIDEKEFQNQDVHQFRRKHHLGQQPFILFIGRLSYEKGPDILLDAFVRLNEKHPDYHLVVAGPDGGMRDQLVRAAQTGHVQDRVHFIGYLGGNDKSQALHTASALVIPSRKEAVSIVALEAGAAGTPILMTNVCGFEQVADINGGYIVTPNPDGIYQGLERMLADPETLSKMGANLKSMVLTFYTWPTVISKYLTLYQDILRERQMK